jgi:hypothetical protein
MAIAPSKLGRFVMQEGFSWPSEGSEPPRDFGQADEILVRRLREAGLVRPDATNGEIGETFRAARSEHAAGGYSLFNSPQERVRVFLEPYLTPKGQRWAEPLSSLDLPDDDAQGRAEAPASSKFWKR